MSKESEAEGASLPALNGLLGEIAGRVSPRLSAISSALHGTLGLLSPLLDELLREQERQMAPVREAMKMLGALHVAATKVHDQVLDALLARGWCHSYHFTDSDIIYLGDLVRSGRDEEIDELMAGFARHRSESILSTACDKYPERAAILTDAFEAHRTGKYTLSIPTLLSQLDGIGCEMLGLGRNFFNDKRRTDALAAIVNGFRWPGERGQYPIGGIHERMLVALKRTWGLTQDTNARAGRAEPSSLNRHGVLHGLDTDYPTEFNSLRCILNLGFVLEARQALYEDIPNHLNELARIMDRRAS